MTNSVFLRHVTIKNYKSIKHCSVDLGPLTFLVGPNGSGKSNFLDALRFVKDALYPSLDQAIRERGGINEVRRRSFGHPNTISFELTFSLPLNWNEEFQWIGEGELSFQLVPIKTGSIEVRREECQFKIDILNKKTGERKEHLAHYLVEAGTPKIFQVGGQNPMPPLMRADSIYLVGASGYQDFRTVFDGLKDMNFYNFYPEIIRDFHYMDEGRILMRNGGNVASVLRSMKNSNPSSYEIVLDFLARICPGIIGITSKSEGKKEFLEFQQRMDDKKRPLRFSAENMSDGTLRALAILVALFQSMGQRTSLIGIEEPEVALHPGAADVLRDALIMASRSTQVIVTSHSPDLLDDKEVKDDWILGVESVNGETIIGPIGDADRKAIRDRLFTAGELLRRDKLRPANLE